MNNRFAILLLLCVVSGSSCSMNPKSMQQKPIDDLRKIPPLEFLDYLKTDTRPMRVFTIKEPLECWVSEKDVPGLMNRLSSDKPSMSVALSIVSNIRKSSKEADEAAFLIKGFRFGKYPPTLGSEPISEGDIKAIRSWWSAYKAGLTPLEPGIERCKN